MATQRIDLTATLPPGASKADLKVMLQHLLADRFDCVVHWDTKDLPFYRLVEGRRGRKFKDAEPLDPMLSQSASTAGHEAPDGKRPEIKLGSDGYPDLTGQSIRSAMIGRRVRLRLTNASMTDLVVDLEGQLTLPIVDATTLKGRYDLTLSWIADEASAEMIVIDKNGVVPTSGEEFGPTLLEALEQQLGLRIEEAKGPVKVLVIDRMRQLPTAN